MPKAYIVLDALGIIALDESFNVIEKVLFDTSKIDEVADNLINIEKSQPVEELLRLINRLKERGFDQLVVEDSELARNLSLKFAELEFRTESPSPGALKFRLEFEDKYLKEVYGIGPDEYYRRLREISDLMTRKKLRQAAEKRDLFIAQAISAVDDIDKVLNLVASRIREWYGLHFPELEELTKDHREYVRIVYEFGLRRNITYDNMKRVFPDWPEDRIRKVVEAAQKSVGADMAEWDVEQLRGYAKIFLELAELRSKLADYIDDAMREVAPNIREIVGPLLGARLIKLAGGLMRLAMLPASTIQVLGAEKALFRALRTGGKPPKHGVIFQYPEIFRSPRWQRGKIARALAAKLAIAAKADAITGAFIAPKLKEDIMMRIQEIKTLYAKPPPRQPARAPTKPVRPIRPSRREEEKG